MMGRRPEQKMKTISRRGGRRPKDVEKQRKDLKIETKEFRRQVTIKGQGVACTAMKPTRTASWFEGVDQQGSALGGAVKAEMADGKVASIVTISGRGK